MQLLTPPLGKQEQVQFMAVYKSTVVVVEVVLVCIFEWKMEKRDYIVLNAAYLKYMQHICNATEGKGNRTQSRGMII